MKEAVESEEINWNFSPPAVTNFSGTWRGYGSFNDGNTARRIFENPEIAAQITKVYVELIKRFDMNKEQFGAYAKDTANLFVQGYSLLYMPAPVHKILIHGADIINVTILPIG
ncbi:hypothetical protein ILUMI_10774 [Ignelater luminosus]|uniref:Uncharacterized protein n=1 Tax=Ignelater luminosus TaxID=2038154 RepID=A0A8K0CZR6_IGNLU|nr:hypothetical protein ILUMI_10774 [Ignelater luminosus]